MSEVAALLTELDATLARVTPPRRLAMLRQMTELFLQGAGLYTAEQTAVFDALIKRLTQGVGAQALVELSNRLATMDSAPADTIVRLSSDDDPAVSGPVLEKSSVLNDGDLVGIARSKSQGHLLAIAGRRHIADVVTDVLVERGNQAVKRKVTANEGATISENGFARLISDARTDKDLAGMVKKREDIPEELKPFLEMALA
ncbi:MAG: DUF2336 domain-containing protein [Pseudolabrys sp.]